VPHDEMPLYDAAEAYLAGGFAPFTTPGHARSADLADAVLARDLPLFAGADDLRGSRGVLAAAEARAAHAWGADWCRFGVAGSTQGNHALCLAAARPGDRVIVARTMHKSLFAGLILAGLVPEFVRPERDPRSGLPLGVTPAALAAAFAHAPDARAVFLVEPSYLGALSDVRALVEIAHAHGVPLLVDGAWGAHLGFHPALPAHALAEGADALVISSHKTLPAFTQSALVFARAGLLDLDRLDATFALTNTTSPSAAILASIDRARSLMETRGVELLERTLARAAQLRAVLGAVPGLTLLDPDGAPGVHAHDPTKLVVALPGTGADGFAVEERLEAARIRLEMVDRDTLVPLLHVGIDAEHADRLAEALPAAIEACRAAPRPMIASAAWSVEAVQAMSPRDAFYAPRERVVVAAAIGRVAAETAAPYPPGIPAIAPGEVVTADVVDALRGERAAGSLIAYCGDPTLETFAVVAS
jgi:arginine decarboxylase